MSTTLKKYTVKSLMPFALLLGFLGFGSLALPDTGLNVGIVAVAHADDCDGGQSYAGSVGKNCQNVHRGGSGGVSASGGLGTTVRSASGPGATLSTGGKGSRSADVSDIDASGGKNTQIRKSDVATVTTCAGDLINGGYAGGLASGAMDLGPSFDFTYVGPNVKC